VVFEQAHRIDRLSAVGAPVSYATSTGLSVQRMGVTASAYPDAIGWWLMPCAAPIVCSRIDTEVPVTPTEMTSSVAGGPSAAQRKGLEGPRQGPTAW